MKIFLSMAAVLIISGSGWASSSTSLAYLCESVDTGVELRVWIYYRDAFYLDYALVQKGLTAVPYTVNVRGPNAVSVGETNPLIDIVAVRSRYNFALLGDGSVVDQVELGEYKEQAAVGTPYARVKVACQLF